MAPLTLFFSYSHQDANFKSSLEVHLRALERQGLLSTWSDCKIRAGNELDREIQKQLELSDVFLLLISSDYIGSEYCWGVEFERAMERHRIGSAIVIPIIVRPCAWKQTSLGQLMALPKDGHPVTSWESQDEAWSSVVEGLRRACSDQLNRQSPGILARKELPAPVSAVQGTRSEVLGIGRDNEDGALRFLRNAMLSHGRYLREKIGEPVFFLTLHPSRLEPMYCGLPTSPSEKAAGRIRHKSRILLETFCNSRSSEPWEILDKVAREFLPDIKASAREIMDGAIAILLSDTGLRMGYENQTSTQPSAFLSDHRISRTPGWFQDALDLAGTSRFSEAAFDARRKQRDEEGFCDFITHPSDPDRILGLRVRNYVRRSGLLRDRFLILLAEYLLFRTQCVLADNREAGRDVAPSGLNHFFLPLKSNGQWRTAACWLSTGEGASGNDGIRRRRPGPSADTQESMNARCAQTHLEGFTTTLMAELRGGGADEKALYRALCVLWWGHAFWFFREGRAVLQVETSEREGKHFYVRDPQGVPPPQGSFFRVQREDDGFATLTIDLRALPGDHSRRAATALSVDVAVVSVRLFELDDADEHEVSEQLAERIIRAIEEK